MEYQKLTMAKLPKGQGGFEGRIQCIVKLAWEDLEQLQMLREKFWQEDESERQTVAAVSCTARGPEPSGAERNVSSCGRSSTVRGEALSKRKEDAVREEARLDKMMACWYVARCNQVQWSMVGMLQDAYRSTAVCASGRSPEGSRSEQC